MWILVLLAFPLVITSSFAEQNFSEQYERGYNIFNPASQYAPDNPLNPAQAFAPDNPFAPLKRSRGHLEEKPKSAESSWEVLSPWS